MKEGRRRASLHSTASSGQKTKKQVIEADAEGSFWLVTGSTAVLSWRHAGSRFGSNHQQLGAHVVRNPSHTLHCVASPAPLHCVASPSPGELYLPRAPQADCRCFTTSPQLPR